MFCGLGQVIVLLQVYFPTCEMEYRGLGLRSSKILVKVHTPPRKELDLSQTLTLDLVVSHVVQRGLQHLSIVGREKSGLILWQWAASREQGCSI